MKYVIRCPYCGTTYNVATDESDVTFMCKSCGGQNSTRNAIEKIEDVSDEIRKLATEVQRRENLKSALNEELEEAQEDINAEYYFERVEQLKQAETKKSVKIFISVAIIFFILYVIYPKEEEDDSILGMYGSTYQVEFFEKPFC